ncbi:MAG: RecX family transcriptional regulator [Patescibacteria group bacterium]|nr:RecX family transcriptional regulator [Patescibacteria group bacterium]
MGLIDDEKFCLWWIEQRQNFRPGGKRLLKLELLKKGVRHELVNQVLDSLAFDSREKENCLKLAEKWQLKHKACLSVLEDKQRIFRYLAGRGCQ